MVKALLVLASFLAAATPSAALEPMPEKAGWHGFDVMGAGVQVLRSNFISGSRLQRFGRQQVDSLVDEPDSVTDAIAVLEGEIGYRFAGSRTYLSASHAIGDILRDDFTATIRLTQGLGSAGVLGVELLAGLPVRVWEDPYVRGEGRDTTNRKTRGARLAWSRIGGSGLEIDLMSGQIKVALERSGRYLGLTNAERRLLERGGLLHQLRLAYHFKLSKRQGLTPRATYEIEDRDGRAVANDRAGVEIAYAYSGEKATVTVTGYAGSTRYDQANPIYGADTDANAIGVSFTATFPSWLPGNWSAGFAGTAYEQNSRIDFFDASIMSFSLISTRRW